jgi:rhodanese-related sulfurtransferase
VSDTASRQSGTPPAGIDIPAITREELDARLHDPSLTVVDVLPAVSYVEMHLPGAVNLPLAEVRERAALVLPDRHADIALYCGSPT